MNSVSAVVRLLGERLILQLNKIKKLRLPVYGLCKNIPRMLLVQVPTVQPCYFDGGSYILSVFNERKTFASTVST